MDHQLEKKLTGQVGLVFLSTCLTETQNVNVDQSVSKHNTVFKRKLWSSGRAHGSRSEGRGFNPCPMLDGSGVKAMP